MLLPGKNFKTMNANAALLRYLLAASLLTGGTAAAQNILNDTVAVNTEQVVELVFPDAPNAEFPRNNDAYMAGPGTKKSLLVQALKKEAPPMEMWVTDGKRKHRFVLLYTAGDVPKKLIWQNTRELKKHVEQREKQALAKLKEADDLCKKGRYPQAMEKYTATLNDVKEADRPGLQSRMAECKKEYEAQANNDFKVIMAKAESFAAQRMCKEADAAYGEALEIKKGDTAVQARRLKSRETCFQENVKTASAALKAKDYVTADKAYRQAADVLPARLTPQQHKDWQKAKAEIGGRRFAQHKKQGDEAYDLHRWTEAKIAYEAALKENESDNGCKQKLADLTQKIRDAEKKKKDEAIYYAHLSKAGKLAAAKDYDGAIAEYEKAEKIFEQRRFPKDKKEELRKRKNTTAKQQP